MGARWFDRDNMYSDRVIDKQTSTIPFVKSIKSQKK
jgi:hypothetical protein